MAARRSLRLRPKIETAVPDTAMVMAAGLGKRMRPLTATRPKPLIEVNGQALIDHVFDRLVAAGVTKAVVNVHYLPDALEAHLNARAGDLDIRISDERELLLETGGGLVRAAPMIDCDPFFAINSDNYWVDGPSDTLAAARLAMGRGRDGRAAPARAPRPRLQPSRPRRFPHGPLRPAAAPRPVQGRALCLHRHPARRPSGC